MSGTLEPLGVERRSDGHGSHPSVASISGMGMDNRPTDGVYFQCQASS